MENNRPGSVWVANCIVLFALLAFFAGVFYDVRIQMSSLSVMTFGLIFFPIAFVLINIGALNRKYPLDGKHRGQTVVQHAAVERDYPENP